MISLIQLKKMMHRWLLVLVTIVCSTPLFAQLTGTKNIPGDYATLGAAIAALNASGVGAGGVTLNVISGNAQTAPTAGGTGSVSGAVGAGYVINITSNAPTASNPVIIKGNGNTVTASALSTAATYNDALFTIAGTSYVTITNFVLHDNSSNTTTAASNNKTEIGVAIVRGNSTTLGSQYCTVSNCTIVLGQGATYTNAIGIYVNSSNSFNAAYTTATSATSAAGANSYNSFYSNTISGVTTGIAIIGTAAFNDASNVIGASGQGNTITLTPQTANMTMTTAFANYVKTRQDGIFIINNTAFAVNYNTVTLPTGGSTNTPDNGIFASTSAAGTYTNTITNNNISLTTATAAIALTGINNGSGNSSVTLKCNYNTVHDTATTGAVIGVENLTAVLTADMNNNTVVTKGTTGVSEGVFDIVADVTLNMNNNTVTQTTTTGQAIAVAHQTGTVTTLSMDNNKVTQTTGAVATNNFGLENTGAATTADMSSNNITLTTSSTSTTVPLYNSGNTNTLTITYDTVATTNNSTGSVTSVRNDGASNTSVVISNNVVTVTSTSSGAVYAIYAGGADSLLQIWANSVTCSGGSGQLIGLYNAPATMQPTLSISYNTFDLSTTGATTTGVYFIYDVATNPDHAGIIDSISFNVLKSTSGISNTTGPLFLVLEGYMNPLDYITYNRTSGTITKSGSGATSVYGIIDQGANTLTSYNTTYISNNNMSNIHVGAADPFIGLSCAIGSGQAMVFNADTVSNIVGGSGACQGLVFDYCAAGTQVTNCLISNNSGTGNVTGISNETTVGTASTAAIGCVISGNKITGLSSSGASGQVFGILENSTASNNVYTIQSDTITSLSVSGNTAPVIYGIYEANALTNTTSSNFIHDFTTTTTTGSATMNGIYSLSGTTANIVKNNIYNLSAGTSAGSSTQVVGVNLASAATTYNIYNNFITSLTAASSNNPNSIIGLYAQANGSTFNTYFNTIGIGVSGSAITSSATNFGAAGILFPNLTSTVLTLKNNIIFMNVTPRGTGISAAVQRNFAATAGTPVSATYFMTNNNIYHTNSGTVNFLYVDDVTGGAGTAKNGYALTGLTTSGTNNINNDANFNICSGSYKTFMGSGRDANSYSESNLSAGSVTGTYAPSGSSYAYGSGVTITSPAITDDYAAVTRSTPPSVGALQFSGSAGSLPPVITYATLNPISYCVSVAPTLTATITSAVGVNTTSGTKPRLYYKGNSDADAYGGANNSSFNGWKYVEANNSSSPFIFPMNYSLLNHTATSGTVISYFVIAQDISGTPLVGYSQVGFASGYCASSVGLTSGAAPTASLPSVNTFTINSVPSFTTTVTPSYFCGTGNPALLSVSPTPYDLSIQWLQDDGSGTFANISGATTNAYGATPPAPPAIATPSATNHYEAQLSCNSSVVATSSSAAVTDYSPQVLTTTPASRCGTGAVTLGATGSIGSVLEWYAAATGGYPLGTGTSFTTPSISATTTYYVADSFGTYGAPQVVGQTAISGATLFAPSAGSGTGINFTVNNACTIQSVNIYPYYSGATAAYAFTISIYSGATVVASYSGYVSGAAGGATAQTVPVNFYLLPGNYQMAFSSLGANAAYQYGSSTCAFPYSANFNTISLTSTTFNPYYFFFYNWQVVAGCPSARTAVTATVNSLPDAGTITGASNPDCTGTALTLSETGTPSGLGTMASYSWSGPNSFTSTAAASSVSPAVFTPTTTAASGIYSLTVTYPGTGCTSNATVTPYISVNATGTPTVTGTTNACVGVTSMLTANPSGGTWSSANTAKATVDAATGIVTAVSAGSVNISYTSPCGSVTVTAFTVNTTPAAITGASAMCTSTSTTLSNSVSGGTWTSGTTSVATVVSSTGVVHSTSSTGITTITYTIGSCYVTFSETVGSATPGSISPASPTVCVGQTTTLSDATGGGVWSSANTAIASINSSTGVVSGIANGTTSVSYTTGCGSVGVSLTVNGTTVTAANNGPICTSSALNLTGTVGTAGTYSWTGPNGFTSASLSPTISSAIAKRAGTYTFSATVGGCTSSTQTFAVIDSLPTAGATASISGICAGGSTRLTGSVSNPTAMSVIAIPYALTTFVPTATLTSASSWSADDDDGAISVTLPFTFNFYGTGYNSVNISANGYLNFGTLISSGDYTAATLPSSSAGVPRNMIALFWHDMELSSGSITYGTTGFAPNRKFVISYNAVPDGSTSQTNSGEIILYETSGNIDMMVTNTSNAYNLTCGIQNAAGTSALTPPGENNAAYSVSTVSQGWRFETPSYNYTWSPATTLSSTAVASPTSTGLSSTQTFTVTAKDQYSSCTTGNTANTTITVSADPTISGVTSSVANLCTGGSSTLTAGSLSGGSGSFVGYIWSGPGGYTNTVTSIGTTTVAVTPTVTGTYSVVAKYSGSGCTTAPATTAITVAAQPSVTAVTPSATNICSGGTVSFTATTAGGLGTPTYTWSGPDITTTTGSSATSPTFSPTLTGTNTYSLGLHYSGVGCNDAGNHTNVTLNLPPSITLGATPNICQGLTSATISYTGATGSPTSYSITWGSTAHSAGFSDVSALSLSGGTITMSVPGAAPANTYTGSLSVSNGMCGSTSYTVTVIVLANPTGVVSSAVPPCMNYGTNIVFTGTSGATADYKIDGAAPVSVTLTGGTYSLSTGAMNTSHTYELLDVHNSTCTTTIDTTVTINPISMQWVGGASGHNTDWNTAANWSCGFVPGASDDVVIPSGTTYSPAIASATSGTVHNMSVASGASLTVSATGVLNVKGTVTNNGNISGTGTTSLNGSSAQTITGSGYVANLDLNNTSGATIAAGSKVIVTNTLSVTSGTFTTNDSLVLNSDSTGTARVAALPPSGSVISGNVQVQQYVPGGYRRYRFVSHPFSSFIALSQIENYIDITGFGGSSNGFTSTNTNSPSAYWYNPSVANSSIAYDPGWTAYTATNTVLSANKFNTYQGVRMFFRGKKGEGLTAAVYTPSEATFTMTGALNQGNQTVTLLKGSGAYADYNMVGNPYASPVDIGTVIYNASIAGQVTGAAFYVWNASLGAAGQYQAIPISNTPYYLQGSSAFQVRAAANGDVLNFTESNKSANITANLFRAAPEYVSLSVYDENYHPWDMLNVKFDDQATDNEDGKLDATKPLGGDLNFYSLSADSKKLAIDARPYATGKVIPLGITSNYAQEFIIKADNITVPAGGKVYLHDKLLQQYVLLEQGTEYKFTISTDKATQGDNRFELTMVPSEVAAVPASAGLNVTMTPNPATDDVKINFTSAGKEKVTVNVTDLSGISVYNQSLGNVASGSVSVPLANFASGIYLVELTSGSQKVVQRLVKE